MGLSLAAVHLMAPLLDKFERRNAQKVLTLGVQDCHFRYDELQAFLERHRFEYRVIAENDIRLTTGFKWVTPSQRETYRQNLHQQSLFTVLGLRAENICALDASPFEGATYVHDLNNPIASSLESSFDLVIDSGTIEHVFSLKDSLFNVAKACKIGGKVMFLSPVDMINHGFVNVNAELFRDFFTLNHFEEVALNYVLFPRVEEQQKRFYLRHKPQSFNVSIPAFSALVFAAYQKKKETILTVPQQGYYRRLWNEPAVGAEPSRMRLAVSRWIDSSLLTSVLARSIRGRYTAVKIRL